MTSESTRSMKIGDARCGMNHHPAVLLAALEYEEIDLPVTTWISTTPFLNCREQGFVIQVRGIKGTYLNMAFFTHRNSDTLCALKWLGTGHISGGVRPEDVPEEAFPNKWTHSATWPYLELNDPIAWIKDQIGSFVAGVQDSTIEAK